ncbi:putative IMV membrane protein [Equine parapoxvirus]|nr:putative IMV membrane protein [Equine parapoxvirus]WOC35505.1 putative IMV membrane protein [Equine parapoxvirus]WOC35522.1 putative IMV membrane protein [Equine parapoxvirus]
MVSDYDPAVLVLIFCITMAGNYYLSPRTKLGAVFVVQSVVFLWFLFHFVHSVV